MIANLKRLLDLVISMGCLYRLIAAIGLSVISSLVDVVSVSLIVPFALLSIGDVGWTNDYFSAPVATIIRGTSIDQAFVVVCCAFLLACIVKIFSIASVAKLAFYLGENVSKRLMHGEIFGNRQGNGELHSGQAVARVGVKVNLFVSGFVYPAMALVSAIFSLCVYIIFLTAINPFLTIVILSFSLIMYVSVYLILRPKLKKISSLINHAISEQSRRYLEAFRNYKVFRFERVGEYLYVDYSLTEKELRDAQASTITLAQSPRFVIETTIVLAILVFIYLGLTEGSLQSGVVVSFSLIVMVLQKTFPSVQQIYRSAANILGANHVASDIFEEYISAGMSTRIKEPVSVKASKLMKITVKSGSYLLNGDRRINIRDSIEFVSGNTYLITGPSGGGKTSFIDSMLGYYDEEIAIFQARNGVSGSASNFASEISYCVQSPLLFDSSLAFNITLEKNTALIDGHKLRASIAAVNLARRDVSLKGGLIGEAGSKLSGGEKQRVALARALYRQPRLIILDEALSALDGDTEEKILRHLHELKETITVFVSHNPRYQQLADQCVYVNDGVVSA